MNFADLKEKTLLHIENFRNENNQLLFLDNQGQTYVMYHESDCCEQVTLDDICGDLEEILNSPILVAEEVSSKDSLDPSKESGDDSFTWTFYKLSTINGSVTIRWFGSSNGYYSESVSFQEI